MVRGSIDPKPRDVSQGPKARILDDTTHEPMGRPETIKPHLRCSLRPQGEASRLAPDSHDLFSEATGPHYAHGPGWSYLDLENRPTTDVKTVSWLHPAAHLRLQIPRTWQTKIETFWMHPIFLRRPLAFCSLLNLFGCNLI